MLKSRLSLRFFLVISCLIFSVICVNASAEELSEIDSLLAKSFQYLTNDPEKAVPILEKLDKLKSSFDKNQKVLFYLYLSNSLGFRGKHQERIDLIRTIINDIDNTEYKTKFLYYLSASLTNVGEYEKAFYAMNEGIALLPKLTTAGSKAIIIQGAINLLNSLGAHDEAMDYANRMLHLEDENINSLSRCYGYANQVEINFF